MAQLQFANTASQWINSGANDSISGIEMKAGFDKMRLEFTKYHTDPTNVLLHFITTPLGFLGVLSLLRVYSGSSSMGVSLCGLYLLTLLTEVPNGVYFGSVLLCGTILYLSRKLALSTHFSVILMILGYLLQDLAHMATGEKTFQSTYSDGGQISFSNPGQWLYLILEHSYFQLPLCVDLAMPFIAVHSSVRSFLEAPLPSELQQLHVFSWYLAPLFVLALGSYCLDSTNRFCFFPGVPYYKRVLKCNIAFPTEGESRREDLKTIRDWVMSQNPSEETSSHWWSRELTADVKDAFQRCAHSSQIIGMFRTLFGTKHYCLDVVNGMNEIYVTGPERLDERNNSDQVFYTRHVDGPWGFVPFVSVYRCILGMDRNKMITTHFPLANFSQNANEGDVLAFDFNREVHYITRDESMRSESDDFRVVLKLHYCVYPRVLAPLGWLMHGLNVRYNLMFRALFLKTINPASLYEHFLAWNVNFQTYVFDQIETYLGQRNVIYVGLAGALWLATGTYEVFFYLTSFNHYFRYMSTFYVRRGIDFGSFKRDVLLFKTMALTQIFYHYLKPKTFPFAFDLISVLMIASGYTVSMLATNALGLDRTYFAAELGLVPPKWIDQFPYGYIPHPMIVSQMWALLGFFKAAHFRHDWPYVIPIHLALYFAHMMQEHFDCYKRYDDIKKPAAETPQHDKLS